ncbi:Peptidoglycan/LPS O-acetylase OafA/YrhL, contains acyltransferase and SGNH-hydrolase domains [Actinopolyspora xinjiangensis]|uniref:Peptidoglycan/LPS O-acetylase OafA/YrhL, contains acyltransferase and SGNH-hydrolase domains n=1 Tax=Actinopolyspora xinjiangensis TaxID=405564 RepID=A0A1H0WWV4_9ACTN|nr:acyltransferase [Actinopolyspora xinjiangensis]SDP95244.1 Peptidoglycan/LPS O-acetylase OafA/YrhL, contains acyltransferase and SGNH-hydrolase domains [Actinopolyspora xinjiangensis]
MKTKLGSELPTHIPSITGLRFIAAAMVFVSHIAQNRIFNSPDTNEAFYQIFNPAGWVGVEFFFILSGFVLTWSLKDNDTVRSFWRRRVVKIFPNHLVTWFAGLLLMIIAGEALNLFHVIPSAFLVHTWIPRMDALTGTNGPNWSLGCELVFYLCFPYIYRFIRKIRPEHLWGWFAAVTATIFAWTSLVFFVFPERPGIVWADMPFWHFWGVYNLPPVRMLEFTLGILLARIVLSGRWISLSWSSSIGIFAVGYLAVLLVPPEYGMTTVAAIPLSMVIATAATADLRGTPSPLRGPRMIWLGEISFAFYLVHYLILHFTLKALGENVSWSLFVGLCVSTVLLLVTLYFANLLYRWVELPAMRRWGRSPDGMKHGSLVCPPVEKIDDDTRSPSGAAS